MCIRDRYNILLKDDKTYSSLRLEIKEKYPRISIVRKCSDKDSLYLGPFKSSENLRKTKRFFQKIFGIRDCTNNKFIRHQKRACLYKDIGMCLGPCDDKELESTYNKNFNLLKDIFTGRVGYFKKIVEEKMIEFAKKEMFEQASFLRDELERLSTNNYYEYRNSESLKNTDVIGIITKNNQIQISILFFRGGYIIDKADLFAISKIQNIQYEQYQMLKQFYSLKSSVPKKIIIDNQFKYFDDLKIDVEKLRADVLMAIGADSSDLNAVALVIGGEEDDRIKPLENDEREGINTHKYTSKEIIRVATVSYTHLTLPTNREV